MGIENAEAVAVPAFTGDGFAKLGTEWTDLATFVLGPIEAVVGTGGAVDVLRILQRTVTVTVH
ncbi:hypothetical protein D3C81_2184990 [compost metagenome]